MSDSLSGKSNYRKGREKAGVFHRLQSQDKWRDKTLILTRINRVTDGGKKKIIDRFGQCTQDLLPMVRVAGDQLAGWLIAIGVG